MSEFLNDIFKISAMCSGVILVLLLVRKILGKKTGAWWRSIVWLLLLVRLCVPISINSSLSIYKPERVDVVTNYISPIVHQESDYKNINDTSDIEDSISLDESLLLDETAILGDTYSSTNKINLAPIGDDIQTMSQVDDVKRPINWLQLVHYFYVCGLVASLVYLIARMLTLAISLKRFDRCTDEKVLQLFLNVKSNMGIRRKVDILVDNNKSVPALCGVFSPKLILPHSAIKCMTEKQLEYVFIHELTHLKRNDVLRLWFVELVLCIHWFNPILYFARPIIRQDMELSCDEKIIMHLQDDSFIDYCNVLMMSSVKKYRPIPGVITANLAGKSGKKLKERLIMIRNFNKKKVIISGILLFITLVVILVACTTQAEKKEQGAKHLGITSKQMNQKIKILAKKYSELADEYDKNPSKDYESGKWEDNRYVHIELDSQPTKSTDSDGLTVYEYKIRHMKVENEDYLIEEYKVSQEIVENNTTSLVYVMAEDNKHIKEISFNYQVDTYEKNKVGDMFNTIVKQAFILAMDKDDSLINQIIKGYTHPLYRNGRDYDNTVMYYYNNDENKRGGDIVPVYNPEIPIYKSREDSLAITPNQLNAYIVEKVEGHLKGFKEASLSKDNNYDYSEDIEEFSNIDTSLIPTKGRDEKGYTTLLYSISKNNKGEDVISIKYTMDKAQKYISRIDLIYNSNNDLTNKESGDRINIYNVDYLEDVLFDGMVTYRKNFNSPMGDKLGKYEGLAFDGTVMKEKVNEGGISTYTIKHIPKPQNNNNTVSHLGITPKDINNNITYLLKNEWLETGLKIDFNNLTKLNEDGKTIIKYSIVKDKYGEEVLSLSYTLASDDKHIESIMTSINQIYAKGKNYSHCIDLNLIVNKAYLLAISGKQDLEGKIALEDKPLYISEINRDVVSKSIIDTGNNTVTTLVKTSLEIDDALKPTEDKVKKYALTLRVTPDKLSMQIQSLMETSTISSELEFNTKATIIEHEYMQKSIEYNLLRKQDSSKILNMYYIINDNNGLVEGINIIYKRYLGDEKTDVLFKDFCKIADNAYLIASGKEVPESTSEPNYEQVALSEWNNNGRIKVFEAAEHEVYTALIGRTNQWPISYLLDTDERYPHLGITVQQFKHNLELLCKKPEFANIIKDIKPKKSTNNNGIVPLEQYAYPIDSNKKGKWVITFSYVLSEDGKHIKSIHRSFDKRIIDGSNSRELQDRYDKLGEMIDIAFVMAKDNIHSYENFSSENFPLPPASHSRLDGTCTLSKTYNDTIYITKEINPLYWEATLISPASPAAEIIYTYDAFK